MVITADLREVIIKPEDELTEVIQNVKTILTTVAGTVPLDREFGIDRKVLDEPINVARAKISAAVVKAVNRYESRVKVKRVIFGETASIDGVMRPSVEVVWRGK